MLDLAHDLAQSLDDDVVEGRRATGVEQEDEWLVLEGQRDGRSHVAGERERVYDVVRSDVIRDLRLATAQRFAHPLVARRHRSRRGVGTHGAVSAARGGYQLGAGPVGVFAEDAREVRGTLVGEIETDPPQDVVALRGCDE